MAIAGALAPRRGRRRRPAGEPEAPPHLGQPAAELLLVLARRSRADLEGLLVRLLELGELPAQEAEERLGGLRPEEERGPGEGDGPRRLRLAGHRLDRLAGIV